MRLLQPTAQILIKIDPYYQRQKQANDSSLWKYKVHADIRGVLLAGPRMRVGLSIVAIFEDLSGYFFGNFRYRANNTRIIWRYATPSACD